MTRVKSRAHLDFIRQFSCIVCGDNTSTEAAHVRGSDRRIAKPESGMGKKPPDWFTVPLCGKCHRHQHSMSERKFWQDFAPLADPILIALALYAHSGDYEAGCRIIEALRAG